MHAETRGSGQSVNVNLGDGFKQFQLIFIALIVALLISVGISAHTQAQVDALRDHINQHDAETRSQMEHRESEMRAYIGQRDTDMKSHISGLDTNVRLDAYWFQVVRSDMEARGYKLPRDPSINVKEVRK